MPNELKPCPFCGSENVKIGGHGKSTRWARENGLHQVTYTVRCNYCHARGGTSSGYTRNALYNLTKVGQSFLETEFDIIQRAVTAWNRRAND